MEDETEDQAEEQGEECEFCGEDHEARDCDTGFCGNCNEILDNCDCEEPKEINAQQWLDRQVTLRR